jgi:protein SCO1/2
MRSRRAGAFCALPGVLAISLLLLAGCSPPAPPFNSTEVSGIDYGRGVRLTDTTGQVRSLEDFDDRVLLVFFGFTSCPDVCPTTLLRLKQLRDALGADAARVDVAVISVDPERDTLERLHAYVKNFDESFIGLRPEPAELDKVVAEFRAIAVKVPTRDGENYTIDHSATIYVYDRSNRLRLIAQPNFDTAAFASDLKRLTAEN